MRIILIDDRERIKELKRSFSDKNAQFFAIKVAWVV
jgi:hypothetical protein